MAVIQENVPLRPLNNYQVGGRARYFAVVGTQADLVVALEFARARQLQIFILGGGTNIVFADEGFDGLVIQVALNGWSINGDKLTSGAATNMEDLVDGSIAAGLSGLEWAGGLPGSLGGAIRGNAGAFQGEIKDVMFAVNSVALKNGRHVARNNQQCQFGYRDSVFKRVDEVIVSATLRLKFSNQATLRRLADEHIAYRKARHPLEYPNGGSVFKNVAVERIPADARQHFREFVKTDPFPVVPSGKIIDDAGLKGYRIGDAQISEKHCNYFVNRGSATASDITALVLYTQKIVSDKFGIKLELEQELVGLRS